MRTYILVVDCNNFFVSCERLFRPDLEGKPVVVLSSNDGCVVARSQEVKDIGIPMGVPHFQIKDIIKDKHIHVFSGSHDTYRNISTRVMRVIESTCEVVEQYSIDEAFISYEADSLDDVRAMASALRAKIARWVGMPVSIGIGYSKTQAKLANDYAKKTGGGVFFVDRVWCMSEGATLSPGVIWGVGSRLVARYRDAGLVDIPSIITAPVQTLERIGGVVARRLQAELSDQSVYKVGDVAGPQKSLMSSQTFGESTREAAVIRDAIAYHVRHVAAQLQQKQLMTDTFHMYIRPKDRSLTMDRWFLVSLADVTNGNAAILTAVMRVVEDVLRPGIFYNKVGILASHTRPAAALGQGSLFVEVTSRQTDVIDEILAVVPVYKGKKAVQLGRFARTPQWQAKRLLRSPQYVTAWSDVPLIKAQ